MVSLKDPSDVGRCAAVCKQFYVVTQKYSLWARLLKKCFWRGMHLLVLLEYVAIPLDYISGDWKKVREAFIHCHRLRNWVSYLLVGLRFSETWEGTTLTVYLQDGISLEFIDSAVVKSVKFTHITEEKKLTYSLKKEVLEVFQAYARTMIPDKSLFTMLTDDLDLSSFTLDDTEEIN